MKKYLKNLVCFLLSVILLLSTAQVNIFAKDNVHSETNVIITSPGAAEKKLQTECEEAENAIREVVGGYNTGDDYPDKSADMSAYHPTRLFYYRQCTDFAAWCLISRNGVSDFTNWYGGVRWGDAKNWNDAASSIGLTVNGTPAVGAIAYWESGTYGHVAWVKSVDGNNITIEEYNWSTTGAFDSRTINSGNPSGYIHVRDIQSPVPTGTEMTVGYDRALPDGDYLIVSAGSSDKSTFYYMDIEGTEYPAAAETNISLCGPLAGDPPAYEVWTLTYNDGFYSIKQYGTDMSLDVHCADTAEGTNIKLYPSNTSSGQKWAISANGRNGYRIQAKCSGFSVDVAGGNISNGTNIRQWSNNDYDAQSWLFIPYKPSQPISNGRYILLSGIDNSLELDVAGDTADIPENANVQIWKDTALSRYNSFDIVKLENGYYSIIHSASGKGLDVSNGVSTFSSNVAVHTANGSVAQQWAITKLGDGYVLRAKCSGLVLDVKRGVPENGTNVQQYAYLGGLPQIWNFVPAEYAVSYDANGGTGAPSKQTKYYKNELKLSSVIPSYTNHKFRGWSTNRNSGTVDYLAGDLYTKDEDAILYAVWAGQCRISFDVSYEGGENPSDILIFSGDFIGELPAPKRKGYTFDGWFAENGTQVKATDICTGDLKLAAHWKTNQYKISLDGNGGTVNGDTMIEVTYDSPYGELPSASRQNYIHQGWFTEDDQKIEATYIVSRDTDHTLYAKWKGEAKTLVLNPNGGELTGSDELEAEYGSPYGELPTPGRRGFRFLGWFTTPKGTTQVTAESTCTGDLTVYAQWVEAVLTVTPTPTEEPTEPTATPTPTEEPAEPTATPTPTEEPAEPTSTPTPTEEPAEPTATPTPTATLTPAPAILKVANISTKANTTKARSTILKVSYDGDGELSFASSNSKIKVDADGVVTIPKNYTGTAAITVKASATDRYMAAEATAIITVNKLANKVTVDDVTKSASAKAQSFILSVTQRGTGELTFSSNTTSVKVTNEGKITIAKNFSGRAKITIKAAAVSPYKAATKTLSIIVKPAKVSSGTAKNSAAGKISLVWKKAAGATGYQIQYSTSKDFKSKKSGTTKNLKATLSNLTKDKTYYVRIRSYKKDAEGNLFSAWTSFKAVKITK